MRITVFIAILSLAILSCKKESFTLPAPEMKVTQLNDITAGQQQPRLVDLDGDGSTDILFTFTLVGDPLMQADKYQFYVSGAFHTDFPVNASEEMPVLQKGAVISANSYTGYEWYNASAILLAQKVLTNTQPPLWEGTWKDRTHSFFPFRLRKDDKLYYGWFEISFDKATEKVILHAAAVAKQPAVAVKAGY